MARRKSFPEEPRAKTSGPFFQAVGGEKRESGRVREANLRRVLDPAARMRRQKESLDGLEQDNFHDDPDANLSMHKKAPKFAETLDAKRKRRGRAAGPSKARFKKGFEALLEEHQAANPESPNYTRAKVPPSQYPSRHFCAVCGFQSDYTCVPCGSRYCSVKCLAVHRDTRCLKWTV